MPAAVLLLAFALLLASPVRAQPPPDPSPDTTTTTVPADDDSDSGGSGDDCSFPTSLDELTTARLGCTLREVGALLGWIAAVLLVAYIVAAIMLRPIPLSAKRGVLGTFRRGRERLPIVGRAYRPRIDLTVTATDGTTDKLARSVHELLISEMGPASDDAWFSERLTGAEFNAGLTDALDKARPGFGAIGKFLLGLLPQEHIAIRIQLHEPTPMTVSLTAEILDSGDRSLGSEMFLAERVPKVDATAVTDHYLLVRPVAAWLAFQLYDVWPGEAELRPNPVNTEDAESFGEFRLGVLLERFGERARARAAYHRAISADGNNVGALLNLALLDSRDRQRTEWSRLRLDDAQVLVDDIRAEAQRIELRVQIEYVQAVASLNRLMWEEQDDAARSGGMARLAGATDAVQGLARTLVEYASHVRKEGRTASKRRSAQQVGRAYEQRAIALAACVAVEHERLGVDVRATGPTEIRAALNVLAGGALLSFGDCYRVLDRPGTPISTSATYIVACALARRPPLPEVDAERQRTTLLYLREALAGDAGLNEWALLDIGDPAFASVRKKEGWTALCEEFKSAPAPQVAPAATNT